MLFRSYKDDDICAVRDILDNELGYNIELQELKDRVSEMMNRGTYHIIVACDNEKVVGYIGFVTLLAFEIKEETIKVMALAVKSEYRRRGIGTQLLKEVEHFAKNNRIGVISLNSGLSRENAHAFYESQGYFKKSIGFIKRI